MVALSGLVNPSSVRSWEGQLTLTNYFGDRNYFVVVGLSTASPPLTLADWISPPILNMTLLPIVNMTEDVTSARHVLQFANGAVGSPGDHIWAGVFFPYPSSGSAPVAIAGPFVVT